MQPALIELSIVVLLVLTNGFFSMAEMAVVSSRKARLQKNAEEGKKNYARALELAENPTRFLSTIQICITLIGTLAGAFGGATLSGDLQASFRLLGLSDEYAQPLALGAVVILITFLSVVFGELIPKRIALSTPERIAAGIVGPMRVVSVVFHPLVSFLSLFTGLIVRIFKLGESEEPAVTEEEIKIMIQEGTEEGVFEKSEQAMVEGVFYLGERKVGAFMTSRTSLEWLEINDAEAAVRAALNRSTSLTLFPVCRGDIDNVVGIARVDRLLRAFMNGGYAALEPFIEKPVFIPESMYALKALELLRSCNCLAAFIVDEFGAIQGMVTLRDLLEEVVGELSTRGEPEEKEIVKASDGSYLVDGLLDIDDFKNFFKVEQNLPEGEYHTLAGFILAILGTLPKTGELFVWDGWEFEIVDMDLNRIDKVRLRRGPSASEDSVPPEE